MGIIRYTNWEKPAKVASVRLLFYKCEEYLTTSYDPNEFASIHIKNIFINLKNVNFEIYLNFACNVYHQSTITSTDVAAQRPIIVTTSNVVKTWCM